MGSQREAGVCDPTPSVSASTALQQQDQNVQRICHVSRRLSDNSYSLGRAFDCTVVSPPMDNVLLSLHSISNSLHMMAKHFEIQDISHTCTSSTSATDRDCGLKMRRLDNETLIAVLFGPSAICFGEHWVC